MDRFRTPNGPLTFPLAGAETLNVRADALPQTASQGILLRAAQEPEARMEEDSREAATTPTGAVFLSYASEDADAAERIGEALRAAGVEVWFDKNALRGGDAWDRMIRRQIRDCALFVPIISANSQARAEGYFRLEWDLADQRTHLMGRKRAFIVPVCTDATSEREADVPDSFLAVQWTRLPGGATAAAFAERVLNLLSAGQGSVPPEVMPVASDSAPKSRGLARGVDPSVWRHFNWVLAAIVALAVGYVAVDKFRVSKHASATTTATGSSGAFPQSGVPEKSIAVLPFVDISEKHDQEYFSDGLAVELLEMLAKVPDLHVIARTSSFSFKGKSDDIPTIARKLNVAHIVEGSVSVAGHRLRVTTQLIRASSGESLWSETYDRDLKDIFHVQDDIAGAVATALKTRLLSTVPNGDRATTDVGAYTRLLQARYLVGQGTESDARRAILVLEQGLAIDPTYAPAWTELSVAHAFLASRVDSSLGENHVKARAAAERAVALDPTFAGAHEALADVKLRYDLDVPGAAEEYAAARRADPSTPRPDWIALYLGCTAGPCYEEIIHDHWRIISRDPLNATAYAERAVALATGGRLEEAEHDLRRAIALSPQLASAHARLVYYVLLPRHAYRDVLETAQLETNGPTRRMALALVYQVLGRQTDANRALADFIASDADNWACQIGMLYAVRGDADAAFTWLERAYRQRDEGLLRLKLDWEFSNIRADPRYTELLRRLKLI
jgi:TolB-like protein